MNSVTAIPKIELIHSMGDHVVVLGQPDDLHGHAFAFVDKQVGDQLPSTFFEPQQGGALTAFGTVDADVPCKAAIATHCAQANVPAFLTSATVGLTVKLVEGCVVPLMWAPHFVGGGTPKAMLDKIDLLVAPVPSADRDAYEFIQQWGHCSCIAAGNVRA
jgi:hypothetical protein